MKQGEYFQLRNLDKALNSDVVKKAKARGSNPPWLKDIAGQLEDPEYVSLTLAERGFLKDLRLLALRRGNKILNDELYLRGQLRLTPRTLTGPKVDRLCALGFLEAYDDANNVAANQLVLSLPGLEESETHSRLEVEVEVEVPPNPPYQGGDEPTARRSRANGALSPEAKRRLYVEKTGYLLPDDELEYQLAQKGADSDEITGHLETAYDLRAGAAR